MIVAMKKCAFIMLKHSADSGIRNLRKLGVLHIEHEQVPGGKDIAALEEKLALINETVNTLIQAKAELKELPAAGKIQGDWQQSARHIIDAHKRLAHLDEYSRNLADSIRTWEKWGDFDPGSIHRLNEQKVFVALYQIPVKILKSFPPALSVQIIFVTGANANCFVASQTAIDLPFKEISLPKMGLVDMRKRLAEDKTLMRSIRENMRTAVCYIGDFEKVKDEFEKELLFQKALQGMGEAEGLAYIKGYIPIDEVNKVQSLVKENKWGFLLTDPQEEDAVPTLLRNPRWIALINPVFRFLEVFPGYRELDISVVFLIFFSIFFGILIGDAGYGLVYFLLTLVLHIKKGRKIADKSVFFLLYVLSFCAIIWGLLTGTFFGQEWFLKAGYKPLAPALNDMKFLQAFCFLLGALHLYVAHAWRAVLKLPSLTALVDIGWIFVLWAGFFLAKNLILGDILPVYFSWVALFGIVAVILFTSPQKNLLKAIGAGLGNLALSLVNSFTDVVSYVRLFAVGLAGVSIADAFNSMAGGIAQAGGFSFFAGALVAIVGHALGVTLGPISVLVHGVRLNILEFAGHANVSWSGEAYKPLKE